MRRSEENVSGFVFDKRAADNRLDSKLSQASELAAERASEAIKRAVEARMKHFLKTTHIA